MKLIRYLYRFKCKCFHNREFHGDSFRFLNVRHENNGQRALKPQQLIISSNIETFNDLQIGLTQYIESNKTPLYEKVVGPNTNPYPFIISKFNLHELKEIQEAIYFAIKSIVQNYDKDSRIRDTYNFSNEVKVILDLCNEKPYENIGSYRPDFLFESGTLTPKICEINARFPLNGYYMSYYGYNLINEYPQLFNCFDNNPSYSDLSFEIIKEIKQIETIYEKVFDIKKPIGILKKKEDGNDVFFFENKYKCSAFIDPSNLMFDSKTNGLSIENKNGSNANIDQFILELHQDEILDLPKNIIKTIVKSCKYFNDLRTIFIVHDKRFLTILSRDDVLSDYLDPFYHNIIKKHRIQSVFTSSIDKQSSILEQIIHDKNDWLIKPCLLGKGKGIVFGKNISDIEWNSLIRSCLNEKRNEYIIQKYVKQEHFPYFDHTAKFTPTGELKLKRQKVVGLLLCYNDIFMGPGVFRTSPSDLIALRQNGCLMFPLTAEYINGVSSEKIINTKKSDRFRDLLLYENQTETKLLDNFFIKEPPHYENHVLLTLPDSTTFELSAVSFKDASLYEAALIKYGIALIKLKFNDPSSFFMLDLIKRLGIPREHSLKGDDFLWDIRPIKKDECAKTDARSHADTEFLMHTDASFERNTDVPRFFGLHVLTHDKSQGGQSLLVKLDDILMNLTKTEVKILCDEKFKFKIPNEFRKVKNIDHSMGPILSFDKLNQPICRYRQDIIIDLNEKNNETKHAFKKFVSLLDIEKSKIIKYFQLQSNTIILVDNCRYLHGRTEIKDSNRHLKRIRFQTKYHELLPTF